MIALFGVLTFAVGAQSKQPQQKPADTGRPSQPDIRGTDQSPLTVRVLPTPRTDVEAAQIKSDREQEALVKSATIALSVLTFLVGLGQLVVYGIQAKRLRETIVKMDEIAKGQTADMGKYIAQAEAQTAEMRAHTHYMGLQLEEMASNGLSQSTKMTESIAESVRAANAMEAAAAAATKNAVTAEKAMYLSMRARMGLKTVEVKNFGPNSETHLALTFTNFGGKGGFIEAFCLFPTMRHSMERNRNPC
jgi:hypothetical protein